MHFSYPNKNLTGTLNIFLWCVEGSLLYRNMELKIISIFVQGTRHNLNNKHIIYFIYIIYLPLTESIRKYISN